MIFTYNFSYFILKIFQYLLKSDAQLYGMKMNFK